MKAILLKRAILILSCAFSIQVYAQNTNQWYAMVYTLGSKWDTTKQINDQAYFEAHSIHLANLRKEGLIALGGRYADKGFMLLKANSLQEAQNIIQKDSSVIYGTFKVDLHPFDPFYYGGIE
ncbi:MAG: hypothetical protein AAGI07_20335, partial [Bacteroidota bacterium]